MGGTTEWHAVTSNMWHFPITAEHRTKATLWVPEAQTHLVLFIYFLVKEATSDLPDDTRMQSMRNAHSHMHP